MSEELYKHLGYRFKNEKLLKLALTHRSRHDENNERVEFLGDAIVNLVIAESLYHQYPYAHEGELSRWRATLINRDTLGDIAREFQLGRYLMLGAGELKSGGSQRHSILSCAMEAVIGAIYLDAGFEVVKECILRWYQPLLASLTSAGSHKDPKTALQESLQAQHKKLPIYTVESVTGGSHEQFFTVSCWIESLQQKTVGKGSSRRRAEQEAAELMLRLIKK
jgi:ribonuclease-3